MNRPYDAAILGVGSAHGDDAIGWRVIDQLSAQATPRIQLRQLANPVEIVDYLDRANEVHVVDAAIRMNQNQSVQRVAYSSISNQESIDAAARGTHGIGVLQALQLAESLGLPTDHVSIWLTRGESCDPLAEPTNTAIESAGLCASAIVQELRSTRIVTR